MRSSVVELSESDRALLTSWTRSSTVSAGRVERARIVLAVADGGCPYVPCQAARVCGAGSGAR